MNLSIPPAIYEFDRWGDDLRNITAYGETNLPLTVSPFAKIEAVVLIYFPQFSELVATVDQNFKSYTMWMHAAGVARLVLAERIQKGQVTGDQADMRNLPEFAMERHAEASAPYVNAQSALLNALKEFGQKEFATAPSRTQLLSKLLSLRQPRK
jgi:hypothetical protein